MRFLSKNSILFVALFISNISSLLINTEARALVPSSAYLNVELLSIFRQPESSSECSKKYLPVFCLDMPEEIESNYTWMAIPGWLAGEWTANSETILQAYNYRQHQQTVNEPVKIKIKRTSFFGTRRGKDGRIWHCAHTPYEIKIDAGSYIEYQIIEKISIDKISDNEVKVVTSAVVSDVSKLTSDIIEFFKEETVTTYIPLRDGLIQATFVVNDYDVAGQPIYFSNRVCLEKRVKCFEAIKPSDENNKVDEFMSFFQNFFLRH